jgi:thioesterase domain-containing protein
VLQPELSQRTRPYTLKEQVANYIKHIREIQPQGPYYIAGFCFFALLAFEVASQLESLGEKVAFVGLIDAHCPDYWIRRVQTPQEADTGHAGLWARSRAVLRHYWEKARSLGIGKQFSLLGHFIVSKLHNRWLSIWLETRVNVYTYFISRDMKLPKWLKDSSIVTRVGVRRHTPAVIKSNLYLFPAQDQPLEFGSDATLGWRTMTSGEVTTMWIPGDHEDMFLDNHIQAMAETIKQAMSQASTDRSSVERE